MANPKTKKRKGNQLDFKRVKAKVGKRALKPANETSTEAKFTTLSVANQNVTRDGSSKVVDNKLLEQEDRIQELVSSKGLALDEIMTNLRHPASAVRISAARGMKDAVTRKVATPEVIRSHLAILMPIAAKCLVDEDAEVRSLALEVMKEIIAKIRVSRQSDSTLLPFMPLLMAHITSALHSLDRKTQIDGTCLVEMMSSTLPSLVRPFAQDFLPAYTNLLSQRASDIQKVSTKSGSASSKSSGNGETSTHKVLRSLFALLKTNKVRRKLFSTVADSAAVDLTIMHSGRDMNAMFVPSPQPSSDRFISLRCLSDLSSFSESKRRGSQIERSSKGTTIDINAATATELLGKIRDVFTEATQPSKEKQDPKEILLILRSAHLFFVSCKLKDDEGQTKAMESFATVWHQYTTLMMAQFAQSPGPPDLIAEIDLNICITILDAHLEGMDVDKRYMNMVIGYLFAELERSTSSTHDNESGLKDDSRVQVHDMLFGAIERLLIISKNPVRLGSSGADLYFQVVRAVATSFFSEETMGAEPSIKDHIARSPITGRIVLLSWLIFAQVDWSVENAGSGKLDPLLRQILQGLASLLGPWASNYLFETEVVVNILHSVVRRLDVTEESSLVDSFRTSVTPLLESGKKRCSIFEEFPGELQRKIIGLMVLLQSPSQTMLDCMAKIAARCWIGSGAVTVSPLTASQLLWSIHNIRRTVSLQSYLGFLVTSMGIAKKPFGKLQNEVDTESVSRQDIFRFDTCVDLVASILCQCDLVKVLSSMQPLFKNWLEDEAVGSPIPEKVLTARAAIFILGRCLSSFKGCGVFLEDLAPGLEKSVHAATCFLLKHIPASHGDGTKTAEDDAGLQAFLEPIASLFEHEGHLFLSCFSELASEIEDLKMTQQTNALIALTKLASDARLSDAMQCSSGLLRHAENIESKLSSGNLDRSAGVLRSLIEVKSGTVAR